VWAPVGGMAIQGRQGARAERMERQVNRLHAEQLFNPFASGHQRVDVTQVLGHVPADCGQLDGEFTNQVLQPCAIDRRHHPQVLGSAGALEVGRRGVKRVPRPHKEPRGTGAQVLAQYRGKEARDFYPGVELGNHRWPDRDRQRINGPPSPRRRSGGWSRLCVRVRGGGGQEHESQDRDRDHRSEFWGCWGHASGYLRHSRRKPGLIEVGGAKWFPR
jgi:hypothetical protein